MGVIKGITRTLDLLGGSGGLSKLVNNPYNPYINPK